MNQKQFFQWTGATALAGLAAGFILYTPPAKPQPTALEIVQSQVTDCAALGRVVRSMAAETAEADFLSDLQKGKKP